jgi:hypothetical protein
MLSHCTLSDYYQMIFSLAQHHNYSISDLENLIPFERDIYFGLLINFLREKEERMKQNARN